MDTSGITVLKTANKFNPEGINRRKVIQTTFDLENLLCFLLTDDYTKHMSGGSNKK